MKLQNTRDRFNELMNYAQPDFLLNLLSSRKPITSDIDRFSRSMLDAILALQTLQTAKVLLL